MKKETFLKDVVEGLQKDPKQLSSKYFYDEKGDKLFQEIMAQPEYYLTNKEMEIFKNRGREMSTRIQVEGNLRILECGAGDGSKALVFIKNLVKQHPNSVYSPIDISPDVLEQLKQRFKIEAPKIKVEPIACDYLRIKEHLPAGKERKLMLFMGSNIGNYNYEKALDVLKLFISCLDKGDYFLIGNDLVKDPKRILAAYNDKNGSTAAFNLNLLERINRELNADFKLDQFRHFPIYNPLLNRAESYIMSTHKQTVSIDNGSYQVDFKPWEVIHTEISKKYYPEEIHTIAAQLNCEVIEDFFDAEEDYLCSLWRMK